MYMEMLIDNKKLAGNLTLVQIEYVVKVVPYYLDLSVINSCDWTDDN
jgi:hypothetical protein